MEEQKSGTCRFLLSYYGLPGYLQSTLSTDRRGCRIAFSHNAGADSPLSLPTRIYGISSGLRRLDGKWVYLLGAEPRNALLFWAVSSCKPVPSRVFVTNVP